MIGLVALAFAAASPSPQSVGEGLNCATGYESLMAGVSRIPSIAPGRAGAGFSVYEDRAGRTIYTSTVIGHPAHPTLVKRKIVSNGQSVFMEMSACGYGGKAALDTLMTEFNALNVQMSAALNGR